MLELKRDVLHREVKPGRRGRRLGWEAAVEGAARRGDVEALVRALCAGRAGASRVARRALERRFVVPRERLWEMFVRERREHVRVQIVWLLARGFRVESMVSLLWVCALAEGRVRDAAVRGLLEWGALWPEVPAHEDFELACALYAAEGALPEHLAAALWGYVTPRTGLRRARVVPKLADPVARAGQIGRVLDVPKPCAALGTRVVRRQYELAPKPFAWVRALLVRG